MASRLARIGAGTLLAGALFMGGAGTAFADEPKDDGPIKVVQENSNGTVQNGNGNTNKTDQFNNADIRAKLEAAKKGLKVRQSNENFTEQNGDNNSNETTQGNNVTIGE
jgi:hypothetical protein